MAWRIEQFVVRGEIRNSNRNTVSGWLEVLRTEKVGETETTQPTLLLLSLTGNLTGELEGRTFRFEVREQDRPQLPPAIDHSFHLQQVGAMGDALYRMVRVPLVPIEEFIEARRRGETPPEDQRASIYLEWYSQNGRVVLELLDPKIEWEGEYCDLADSEPNEVPSPDDFGPPEITTFIRRDDGTFEILDEPGSAEDSEDDSDPFALFPRNLDKQIRESAGEIGRVTGDGLIDVDNAPWMDGDAGVTRSRHRPCDWDEVILRTDPETWDMSDIREKVISGTRK